MRVDESGPPASVTGGTSVSPMPSASARAGQEGDIAASPVAEGEIRAAGEVPGGQPVVQYPAHECFGRHQAEPWSNGNS